MVYGDRAINLMKCLTVFLDVQVLSRVGHVLESNREVKVRQGAIVVIKLLIKGLSHDAIQVSRCTY